MSSWKRKNLPSIPLWQWGYGVLFLFLIAGLGYGPAQSGFGWIAGLHGAAFLVYLLIYKKANSPTSLYFFLGVAVLARLLLIGAFPQLSDDIYRFVWDGRLINQGVNPFAQLPAYYMQEGNQLPGLTPDLFARLNSPAANANGLRFVGLSSISPRSCWPMNQQETSIAVRPKTSARSCSTLPAKHEPC